MSGTIDPNMPDKPNTHQLLSHLPSVSNEETAIHAYLPSQSKSAIVSGSHFFSLHGYGRLSSRVEIPHGSRFSWGVTGDELKKFPPFKPWLTALNESFTQHEKDGGPFKLHNVTIRCIDEKVKKDGSVNPAFVKLLAPVTDKDGNRVGKPYVFLRGNSVAILIVQEGHVLLTIQPRIAAGDLKLEELPAGKVEYGADPESAAREEIEEETGLSAKGQKLYNMSEFAGHKHGSYASPGGQDEKIMFLLWKPEKKKNQDIFALHGQKRGKREEGERIELKVVKLDELFKVPDMKAQTAWALYHNLQAQGKV